MPKELEQEKICPIFVAAMVNRPFMYGESRVTDPEDLKSLILCRKEKCKWWKEDKCIINFLADISETLTNILYKPERR